MKNTCQLYSSSKCTFSIPRNLNFINYAIIFVFLSSSRNMIINQSECVFSLGYFRKHFISPPIINFIYAWTNRLKRVTLKRRNVGTALISYLCDTSGKFSASSCKIWTRVENDFHFLYKEILFVSKIENAKFTDLVKFNMWIIFC